MSKRSNFERIERDYYPTPFEAVKPLLPHLPSSFTFIEPCAGDGRLIKHINADCIDAYDIEPQSGSVRVGNIFDYPMIKPDYFITNPPWDRKILHPAIEHLSFIAPTWLLFDADWAHTKQSKDLIKRCVKIVSVGRVKWIENSKMTGKDNCAWYLFDDKHNGMTQFIGRTNGES
jgi:hypothetical protein